MTKGASLIAIMVFVFSTRCFASEIINSQNIKLADGAEAGFMAYYPGEVYGYESGYGRVQVKTSGFGVSFGQRLSKAMEISYEYLEFDVKSYFSGARMDDNEIEAHAVSLKFVAPARKGERKWDMGFEYKYLAESTVDDIHFAGLFTAATSGHMRLTGGITSRFGKGVEERSGGFATLSFLLGEDGEMFIGYNELDFLRSFIKHNVAAAARNIGTFSPADAPDEALTFGLELKKNNIDFLMYLYGLDRKIMPAVGANIRL